MFLCPICTDIIFPTSESSSSTHCGHISHTKCLDNWMLTQNSCPQCRQPAKNITNHRIYLPSIVASDGTEITERLEQMANEKQELETVITNLKKDRKRVEKDLKLKRKQHQKLLQRQKKIGTESNNKKSATSISLSFGDDNVLTYISSRLHPKKRNAHRMNRTKEYFKRKRAAQRELSRLNNNNNSDSTDELSSSSSNENVL